MPNQTPTPDSHPLVEFTEKAETLKAFEQWTAVASNLREFKAAGQRLLNDAPLPGFTDLEWRQLHATLDSISDYPSPLAVSDALLRCERISPGAGASIRDAAERRIIANNQANAALKLVNEECAAREAQALLHTHDRIHTRVWLRFGIAFLVCLLITAAVAAGAAYLLPTVHTTATIAGSFLLAGVQSAILATHYLPPVAIRRTCPFCQMRS